MAKVIDIQVVPIKLLEPDKDQPRKQFDVDKLGTLIRSIKRLGIRRPITVERQKTGNFLIVDGEHRYRAALELGLKEVPVSIEPEQSKTDRLIEQFHLQEQHLSWTAMEKAVAILSLSKSLDIPIQDLSEVLQLPRRTVGEYQSFAELSARKIFERSELPLKYASLLHRLTNFIESKYNEAELEFSREDKIEFQKSVIGRIKNGEIENQNDFAKIRDIATKDIKLIKKFVNSNKSVNILFADSNAKVAFHTRNLVGNLRQINSHYKQGEPLGLIKLLENDSIAISQIKSAKKIIDRLFATLQLK